MNRIVLSGLLILATPVCGQDWAGFRGTDGSGVADSQAAIGDSEAIGLKLRWKVKLGSGYSSVVVAGNRLVTMFCNEENDFVVCLDTESGSTKWRTPVGNRFVGENGSFDGPISTPLIVNDYVYALDPGGTVVCLRLADGETVWSKNLVDDFKAKRPMYGFATSPLAIHDRLILQTGGKDGALACLSLETGELLWATTIDAIDSQSPAVCNIDGVTVVLSAGQKLLCGVDVATGQVLFQYEHQGGNGSAMVPVVLPGNKVLLTLDDAYSKAVSLKMLEDQVHVSEEWQDRSIKNTYNVPVYCNRHLFAYSTRILTCVDPATGRPKWKSRQPGDGFLVAVDGHLIINTKKGSLHLAKASADKYSEIARLELFEDLVWSLPSFSNDAIFCRSLGEVACVEIDRAGERIVQEDMAEMPMAPTFTALLSRVNAEKSVTGRQQIVEQFLDQQNQLPYIEGDVVHFLYQGDQNDVAVAGDIFGARQEKQMKRIADTNLFYFSMRLPMDQRANYVFLVNYVPTIDARNQRQTTSSMYAGEMEFAVRLRGEKPLEMSWFSMPNWSSPDYLDDLSEEVSGKIVEHRIDEASEAADAEIYLPNGYHESESRYRTIYVVTDPTHKTIGKLLPAIEKIVSTNNSIEPAIVVFPKSRPFGAEPVSLADDLIPSVDQRYRTKADRSHRSCVGFGMSSGGALNPVFENPDVISRVSAYSPMIFDAGMKKLASAAQKLDQPIDVYIEWGRFDMFNPHENWDVRAIAKQVYDQCKNNDQIRLRGGMVSDSADWSSWRNRFVEFLKN